MYRGVKIFPKTGKCHQLPERGPDWSTIETIVVGLNPKRAVYPGDTVEAAERH